MPKVVQRASQVEKLPPVRAASASDWSNIKDVPSFKRATAVPEDPES